MPTNAVPDLTSKRDGKRVTLRPLRLRFPVFHALLIVVLCTATMDTAQAQIAFRAASSGFDLGMGAQYNGLGNSRRGTGATVTPSLPPARVAGDLLLTIIEVGDLNAVTMPSPNWTLLTSGTQAPPNHQALIFWRIATNTNADRARITHANNPGTRNVLLARVVAFSNVDNTNPFDGLVLGSSGGVNTTVNTGTITTTNSCALLVATVHISDNNNIVTPPSGANTWYQSFYSRTTTGNDSAIGLWYSPAGAAGIQPSVSITYSGSNDVSHAAQFALRPSGLTLNVPAGTQAGDVMIATVATRPANTNPANNNAKAVCAPLGWTLVRDTTNNAGGGTGGTGMRLQTYYRVATAAEPASYTWFAQLNNPSVAPATVFTSGVGGIVSYSGVDNTTPVDVEGGNTTGNSYSHTGNSITTTVANTMLVASHSFLSADTWSPPAGMTERIDQAAPAAPPGNAVGIAMEVSEQLRPVAAATGNKTAVAGGTSNTDNGIVHMLALRPGNPAADHYYVQNAASGVNCQAENITITAHDVAHVPTSALSGTITITANRVAGAAGTHGDYAVIAGIGTLVNGAVDDGIATYTFGALETAVVLSYKNTWVQTVNLSVSDGTATDTSGTASADAGYDQNLSFVPSGFRFIDAGNNAIPNQVAGVTDGPFYLQAIQTGAGGCSSPGPCTGVCTVPTAFGNGVSADIDLAFRCDNPITCQPGQQVSITNNGTTPIAANPASGVTAWTSKTIVFGANGQAAFNMVYPDVGAISLHARYDIPLGDGSPSGNLMTGTSNTFVVSPYGFLIATTVPNEIKRTSDGFVNPGAATAADVPFFIRAGDDFSVTVTAVNQAGVATPNYGQDIAPETVQLTANLAGGLGLTNNPGLTNPTSFGPFTAGRATGTTFSWGEVGIITLTPSVGDGNYLGAGDVTGTTSGNVGRFVPFDFSVTRNVPMFDSGCSAAGKDAFTYIGEPFLYQTPPVITVTARNKAAGTTLNYSGDFFKITAGSLTGKAYTAATGALDPSGIPGTDPAIRFNGDLIAVPPPPAAGTGTLTFSTGTGLFFTRTTPVAAFDADISLAINVIDADGTTVALVDGIAGVNPVRFGQATPGNGILFAGTTVTVGKTPREMRFGRLRMNNVAGTTRLGLPLRMQAQFYTATGFLTNGDDSCTSFAGSDTAMAFVVGTNLVACDTAAAPSGALTLVDGKVSGLQLAAPGIGNDGSVDLIVNLGATGGTTCTAVGGPTSPATATSLGFLQGNWGGAAAWDQDPRARATFGIHNDAAEFIYLQENY